MISMNKAVFLDRDGTINVDKGYVYKVEDFYIIDGVLESIKILNKAGYNVIIITNQSGVARGYYSEEDVIYLHKYIKMLFNQYDVHIDDFYYCPHHPILGVGKYKFECNCRKPKSGLIERGIKNFNIDVNKSWMIGDKESDVIAGINAGLRSILLCELPKKENEFISLLDAVKYIVNLGL